MCRLSLFQLHQRHHRIRYVVGGIITTVAIQKSSTVLRVPQSQPVLVTRGIIPFNRKKYRKFTARAGKASYSRVSSALARQTHRPVSTTVACQPYRQIVCTACTAFPICNRPVKLTRPVPFVISQTNRVFSSKSRNMWRGSNQIWNSSSLTTASFRRCDGQNKIDFKVIISLEHSVNWKEVNLMTLTVPLRFIHIKWRICRCLGRGTGYMCLVNSVSVFGV